MKWMLSTLQIQSKKGSCPEEFTFFRLFFIGLVASETADISLLTAVCHIQKLMFGYFEEMGHPQQLLLLFGFWLPVLTDVGQDLASGRTKELSEEQT